MKAEATGVLIVDVCLVAYDSVDAVTERPNVVWKDQRVS